MKTVIRYQMAKNDCGRSHEGVNENKMINETIAYCSSFTLLPYTLLSLWISHTITLIPLKPERFKKLAVRKPLSNNFEIRISTLPVCCCLSCNCFEAVFMKVILQFVAISNDFQKFIVRIISESVLLQAISSLLAVAAVRV